MSKRIEQALGVLGDVRARSRAIRRMVRRIRADAVRSVARRHGVTSQTVFANIVRPIRMSAADLDRLLLCWLGGDGARLQDALLKRARGPERDKIEGFFAAR